MTPIVLSIFDLTGNMVRPWLDAGYECWIVDIQHPRGVSKEGSLVRVGCDVRHWLPPRREYRIAFAFSPCTDMAVSGARWFKDKGLAGLAGGIELAETARDILEWCGCPWMMEHPVSTLATYWRKPDHSFDPCDYGDPYTKKTNVWCGGGFVMPEKCRVEPTLGSKMHLIPPSDDRANLRSATPMGFARAVYEANSNPVDDVTGGAA